MANATKSTNTADAVSIIKEVIGTAIRDALAAVENDPEVQDIMARRSSLWAEQMAVERDIERIIGPLSRGSLDARSAAVAKAGSADAVNIDSKPMKEHQKSLSAAQDRQILLQRAVAFIQNEELPTARQKAIRDAVNRHVKPAYTALVREQFRVLLELGELVELDLQVCDAMKQFDAPIESIGHHCVARIGVPSDQSGTIAAWTHRAIELGHLKRGDVPAALWWSWTGVRDRMGKLLPQAAAKRLGLVR